MTRRPLDSVVSRPIVAALVAACAAACGGGGLTDARKAEIQAAVASRMQVFADGASQRDASMQASIMAPDVVLVDVATEYQGTTAFVDATSTLLAQLQAFEMRWDTLEVDVLAPDAAAVRGRAVVRRQHVDGRMQASAPFMYFTGVFRLMDGEWKLTRGHLSGFMRGVQGGS